MIMISSVAWEFFEYFSDTIFKTSAFGVYGQYKFRDTAFDLLFDMLGIALGTVILLNKKLHR